MISRQIIKQNAKLQLGSNIFGSTWLMALLILLIESAIISVAGYCGGIPAMLVEGPLVVGVTSIFVSLLRGNNIINIEDMFKGFRENLGRNLILGFLANLFVILWTLLFIFPGIVKAYAYSMAYYIANEHPEYDWKACLDESQRLTRGHKLDLFVLDLSFIGWYIVGAMCLGIGVLWVAPYHSCAKVNYYDAIMKLNGMNAAETVNDIPQEPAE